MAIEQLNAVLWQERELLEELHFAIDMEQMVYTHGDERWRGRVRAQVSTVCGRLRETEILRAIHTDAVAGTLGLEPGPSLVQLAREVDEPWRSILLDQRTSLQHAVCELESRPRCARIELDGLRAATAASRPRSR